MCNGGFIGGPELLLIIPFIPLISAYQYTKSATKKSASYLHSSTVKLNQALYPSVLDNKITAIKTKLSVLVLASNETLADLNAKLGLLYLAKSDILTAYKYLATAIELCPTHYLYHYYMSLLQGRSNNRKAMIESLKLAVKNLHYKAPEKSAAKKFLHSVSGMFQRLFSPLILNYSPL